MFSPLTCRLTYEGQQIAVVVAPLYVFPAVAYPTGQAPGLYTCVTEGARPNPLKLSGKQSVPG